MLLSSLAILHLLIAGRQSKTYLVETVDDAAKPTRPSLLGNTATPLPPKPTEPPLPNVTNPNPVDVLASKPTETLLAGNETIAAEALLPQLANETNTTNAAIPNPNNEANSTLVDPALPKPANEGNQTSAALPNPDVEAYPASTVASLAKPVVAAAPTPAAVPTLKPNGALPKPKNIGKCKAKKAGGKAKPEGKSAVGKGKSVVEKQDYEEFEQPVAQ